MVWRSCPQSGVAGFIQSIYSLHMKPLSHDFMDDLRRLRVLREFRERGTVTATAEALHLTPSAVSQQLAGLAHDLGFPITRKDGRRIALTPRGEALLSHADAVFAQLEHARHDLQTFDETLRGTVRIGAFSTALAGLLPTALDRLATDSPTSSSPSVKASHPNSSTNSMRAVSTSRSRWLSAAPRPLAIRGITGSIWVPTYWTSQYRLAIRAQVTAASTCVISLRSLGSPALPVVAAPPSPRPPAPLPVSLPISDTRSTTGWPSPN